MTRPEDERPTRFGPFFVQGETWRLCEDEDVRARDLAEGSVTLTRPETGETRVLRTADIQHPPIPGLEEIPDEDRYDLRQLVEDMLSLGFDSGEADVIMGLVTRRRLLREPGGP
jgi:hypothetical protein